MEDIPRLSPVEREILCLLIARGPMYGLEMVKASKTIKRGTIYVTLMRMTDKGFVTSEAEDDPTRSGLPRRRYQLTGLGQKVYRSVEATVSAFVMPVPIGAS